MIRTSTLLRALLVGAGTLVLAACLPSDGEVSAGPGAAAPAPVSMNPPATNPPATTPPPTTPPPTNPPAAPTPVSITMSWNANTESDLRGYRVYFGTASGTYQQVRGAGLDAGRSTTFSIPNLRAGTTYFVAVTSYDSAGNESAYSGEVSGQAR